MHAISYVLCTLYLNILVRTGMQEYIVILCNIKISCHNYVMCHDVLRVQDVPRT